ncbi:MAG: ABC transporter ATP-binding protein [Clostridia bacterium]|nr:ABC transporter ATP-binding protein [Clostridia bacterium]
MIAVNDLSLEVEEGKVFALLGVNGAGKTTLVKTLSCLVKPTSGDAFVLGKSVVKEPYEVKKLIDISMQETAVAANLTVRENLEFYARICGFDKAGVKAAVDKAFSDFGLDKYADKRAKTLSGGWQRKLSIALALVSKPKVLFLDEPTLGLDVLARRELWKCISALKGQMTVILTTHYMEEAESLSDEIAIMKEGRILAVGTSEYLKQATGAATFEDAFVSVIEKGGI